MACIHQVQPSTNYGIDSVSIKHLWKGNDNIIYDKVNYAPGCKDVFCEDTSEFNDALEAAKNSDTVIYVGGINKKVEAEGHDRSDIALPSNQEKLVTE
jgi:hypothetical protein